MFASPYFSHSKRLPNFLRFVVEHTLAGDAENIKERTLGIEIFGRDAAYDTAADPIVRVTAAEIRKRMAQYYQDPAHEEELRISLPSGSYIPHFTAPGTAMIRAAGERCSSTLSVEQAAPPVTHVRPLGCLPLRWSGCRGAWCTGTILFWHRTHHSGFD